MKPHGFAIEDARARDGPSLGQGSCLRRNAGAIAACPRTGLDALSREVWRAYGADVLSEGEASELCEAIAARRVVPLS